jgi:hypothetical protein
VKERNFVDTMNFMKFLFMNEKDRGEGERKGGRDKKGGRKREEEGKDKERATK